MARGPQFRLGKIPVRIDPSFLLVVALFTALAGDLALGLAWAAVLTASILLHELGHAVAFRAYGSPASIQLHGFGGLTIGSRLPPRRSIVVSLAGPLSELVLLGIPGAILLATDSFTGTSLQVLEIVVWINLFWSLVNLIPMLPLDGGNVTLAVMQLLGRPEPQRLTRQISVGVAAVAAATGLWFGLTFAPFFALFFLVSNLGALRGSARGGSRQGLAAGQRALLAGDTRAAITAAEEVLATRPPADLARSATELAVWGWLREGNIVHARGLLARLPADAIGSSLRAAVALAEGRVGEGLGVLTFALVNEPPGVDQMFAAVLAAELGQAAALTGELLAMDEGRGVEAATVLASLLHHAGRFDEAASVGHAVYHDGRSEPEVVAFNVACSLAQGGRLDDSLGWLAAAIDAGWTDLVRLTSDRDLAPLRTTPGYLEMRSRLVESTGPA